MTLEEKAGQLFQHMITIGEGGTLDGRATRSSGCRPPKEYVLGKHMSHWNLLGVPGSAREIAEWHNRLQALCAETRLGIPATIATDPRHAFTDNPGTALLSGPFSQWPETLGLAATRDEALDGAARRRRPAGVPGRRPAHRAAPAGRPGHRAALGARQRHVRRGRASSPGRWAPRTCAGSRVPSFGAGQRLDDDQALPRRRTAEGRRGPALRVRPRAGLPGRTVRRAPGAVQGAPGGRDAADDAVLRHAGRAAGDRPRSASGSTSRSCIDLLRDDLGFDGIICTDWGLVTDAEIFGQPFPARAWGVEHLSVEDRVALILDAGADQLGGESCPEVVVALVRAGRDRARRGSTPRSAACSGRSSCSGSSTSAATWTSRRPRPIVGNDEFRAAGLAAQAAARHRPDQRRRSCPLARRPADLRRGVRRAPVDDPADADVAILRLKAPYEQRGPGFEAFFHAGSLDFPAGRDRPHQRDQRAGPDDPRRLPRPAGDPHAAGGPAPPRSS